jgi:diaminohydroxyphosphoribosylaminopyrimidine deaminase/5-amino-6-(5-phosphoribosylamino)uracil reductase
VASEAEIVAMRRAIRLADQALGTTSPNPPVGCVILDAQLHIVGEGFTSPPGGPHAEVNALRAAGTRAQGGTVVVTLEPCSHHGRTPPCTQALIAAGVGRVVFAVSDPHTVAAGGAEALQAAGVEVEGGVLSPEAARGNEAWLTYIAQHRPLVTWVYGASLDGRVAAIDGTNQGINGDEAVADIKARLRAESDAVMVDYAAARSDDSSRAAAGKVRDQPLTVVVDPDARTPDTAHIFDGPSPTLLAVAEDAHADHLVRRTEVMKLPRSEDGLDLTALLTALHDRDVCSVLLEGGPALAGSFVTADLVDRVVAYFGPILIGGGGMSALMGEGAPSIDAAQRFRLDEVTPIGRDTRVVARHPTRLR